MSQQPPPPAYGKDPEGRAPFVNREYPPAQDLPQHQYPPQQGYALQQPYPQQGYVSQQTNQTTVIMTNTGYHNDYMGFSIFNMLCCCLCIGIAALIQSCSARDANNRGDFNAAQSHGKQALLLNKVGLGIGLGSHAIWIVILIVLLVTGAVVFASASSSVSTDLSDWSDSSGLSDWSDSAVLDVTNPPTTNWWGIRRTTQPTTPPWWG